jgi:hypothetical protein
MPDESGQGDYSVWCVSATGDSLSSVSFGQASDSPLQFVTTLAYPDGTAQIDIRKAGRTLHTIRPSFAAPRVALIRPVAGETVGDTLEVAWSASDADGDSLVHAVLYSADQGTSWIPLALDATTSTLRADISDLPGGKRCLVKVVTSDGFNDGETICDAPFTVANRAPLVSITDPTGQVSIAIGETQELHAVAYDLEENVLSGDRITWTSDQGGSLGKGASTAICPTTAGIVLITASAVDTEGAVGKATFKLNVVDEGEDVITEAGQPFTLSTPQGQQVELMFAATADPAKADLHLRATPPRGLQMRFEGRWMRIGSQDAFGQEIRLIKVNPTGRSLEWTIAHSLPSGKSIRAYVLRDGSWHPIARIVAP